jgi:hypothetical protein
MAKSAPGADVRPVWLCYHFVRLRCMQTHERRLLHTDLGRKEPLELW